jgi:hypothetical protein
MRYDFLALAVIVAACGDGSGPQPPAQAIADTESPIITLTGDNPQIIPVGDAYVELGATAMDDRDGDLTGSIVIDASAVDSSLPNQYLVTYDVSDSSGNVAATAIRTVIYEDRTPPSITLLGDNPQTIIQGDTYVELGAIATDNVDGDLTDAITIDHSAVDTGQIGSYEVTYDVEDSSGNHATSVVRTVNVEAPAVAITWYRDVDQDGYSNGDTEVAAARPPGYYEESELTAIFGDCDDSDASVNPVAADIDADGIDQDCNGFEISGAEEVVFDWTTDRCDDLDIPDLPARAFVDKDGQVQLISSHYDVRRSIGPNLDNLVHDCTVVMTSHRDPDPANFNDSEWIGATYTEDGTTIYAIIHNEFHGWAHPGYCSIDYATTDCWYNGLTLAVSTNSGLSYEHPVAPPLHLIAASSLPYVNDTGPHGVFHPSSIVKHDDGYYYAIFHRVRKPAPEQYGQWACLARTPDLADPDAWRFWNHNAFDGHFINPYSDEVVDPSTHDCPAIDFEDISDMTQSLTYNEYLDKFILVGTGTSIDGMTHGFFISFSDDMIDWTPRALLLEETLSWDGENPSQPNDLYPSLLDPESTARNFDRVGKTGYVYFTRNNRAPGNLDRDMLRVPVEFFVH